ncbi:HK97 family phage prohead protease [Stenotrophomonas sp. A3_2]
MRELRAVDLLEISVVSAFPAYPDTTVAARSARLALVSPAARRAYLAGI